MEGYGHPLVVLPLHGLDLLRLASSVDLQIAHHHGHVPEARTLGYYHRGTDVYLESPLREESQDLPCQCQAQKIVEPLVAGELCEESIVL